MTEQPVAQPAEAKPGGLPSRLAVAARRARYAILWERVWPPLAALATAAGLFLALSWLGLWLWLPPLGRAAGLVLFGALALWAAFPFLGLRLPGFADALHRLDRVSGLRHRPATTLADRLAVNAQDPYALALWNAHVARSLQNAKALRAGAPAPRVAGRDPYALRGLVLIAVIATFMAAGGERWHRVAAAFDWRGVVMPANFRVDAWVAPPAYTARPPIILPGIHPGETSAAVAPSDGPISVPVNSTLVVRATGKLKLELSTTGGLVPAKEEGRPPAGAEEHRFSVTATGAATLRAAGENLTWPLNAVPDKPPTIALIKDPEQQTRGALLLSYRLEDDYGVAEAQATFARNDDPGAGGHAARPLFGPPDFALVLPQARTRNGTGQTIKDLTDHPWAGAEVTLTLVARDDAGNEGRSEPFAFRLPERIFTKPLARALIEQR
ncbi:MAG TPA: TIGR02302 family protein, partial [Xanthobacteraceae bacterium]|nr:TIGR02302 family protein [Xanthobacteraceae bacterium]